MTCTRFMVSLRNQRSLPLILVGFLALPSVWGCGAPITVPLLGPEEIPQFEKAGNYPEREYHIEPGDTIQIRYTFHTEMNQEVVVLPDGKIAAQLVGEITVSGMTTTQLEKILAERTSDRLRDPEVVVSITKFAEKTVYIGGEVERPGPVAYRKGLSPLQAIIAAGGFGTSAQTDSVIVVRAVGPDEKFISRKLNLAQAITDGVKEPIYLAPHDVVYVPKTAIADANLWVKQHITDLLPFLFPSVGTASSVIRTMGR